MPFENLTVKGAETGLGGFHTDKESSTDSGPGTTISHPDPAHSNMRMSFSRVDVDKQS